MRITLNYPDYLKLLTTMRELEGLVQGLVMYSSIPREVKERSLEVVHTSKAFLTSLENKLEDEAIDRALVDARRRVEEGDFTH